MSTETIIAIAVIFAIIGSFILLKSFFAKHKMLAVGLATVVAVLTLGVMTNSVNGQLNWQLRQIGEKIAYVGADIVHAGARAVDTLVY